MDVTTVQPPYRKGKRRHESLVGRVVLADLRPMIRNRLGKVRSPRERAKMDAWACPVTGPPRHRRAKDAPTWQKAGGRWWMQQGSAINS
jgi:hypothetical protein